MHFLFALFSIVFQSAILLFCEKIRTQAFILKNNLHEKTVLSQLSWLHCMVFLQNKGNTNTFPIIFLM